MTVRSGVRVVCFKREHALSTTASKMRTRSLKGAAGRSGKVCGRGCRYSAWADTAAGRVLCFRGSWRADWLHMFPGHKRHDAQVASLLSQSSPALSTRLRDGALQALGGERVRRGGRVSAKSGVVCCSLGRNARDATQPPPRLAPVAGLLQGCLPGTVRVLRNLGIPWGGAGLG